MIDTIVILAAGAARRFGSLKQLAPVGPDGEALLDYTLFDATRAGFSRAVLVVSDQTHAPLADALEPRCGRFFRLHYAPQRLDDLPGGRSPPPDRTRPWGTAHAVLCGARAASGPFAVANADDFYGRESIQLLCGLMRDAKPDAGRTHALVGFPLGATLPAHGVVSRAECRCDATGRLRDIREWTGVRREGDAARAVDAAGVESVLPLDTITSMNLWAFAAEFRETLEAAWARFAAAHGDSRTEELFLPDVVRLAIRADSDRVRVARSAGPWFGLTHRDDLDRVRSGLRELIDAGVYPSPLWRDDPRAWSGRSRGGEAGRTR